MKKRKFTFYYSRNKLKASTDIICLYVKRNKRKCI